MTEKPHFHKNKSLKNLCTFGIGGPAKHYVEVRSLSELQETLKICSKQKDPFFVLGKGSNIVFEDQGFRGIVIHNKIEFCEENPSHALTKVFHVGAGYSFSLLGTQTARKGWSGLEFASGIPGSVGGAVFMNAGASGSETCDFLKRVFFVTQNGELQIFEKKELSFSYRHSSFQNLKGAIASAEFELTESPLARSKQLEIINYRTHTQPYGDKSAGCIFRNPEKISAGALIDKCGLKGLTIGGAKVSEIHANFIVNANHASSADIHALIAQIQERVKNETGIELEKEVRFVS